MDTRADFARRQRVGTHERPFLILGGSLTDKHRACRDGFPVVVDLAGAAYGPLDLFSPRVRVSPDADQALIERARAAGFVIV